MRHNWLMIMACGALLHGKTAVEVPNADFSAGFEHWQVVAQGVRLMKDDGGAFVRFDDTMANEGYDIHSELLPGAEQQWYEIAFECAHVSEPDGFGIYLECFDKNRKKITGQDNGELQWRAPVCDGWTPLVFYAGTPAKTAFVQLRVHTMSSWTGHGELRRFKVTAMTTDDMKAVSNEASRLSIDGNNRAWRFKHMMLQIPYETIEAKMKTVEVSRHPRLFACEEEFNSLKQKVEAVDGVHRLMLKRLCLLADGLLTVPALKREMEGRRLLGISRKAVYRLTTLGLCYRMTGKTAYRDKCLQEMRAIAAFSNWNPSHYLDVGEMTLAMATGYDWLYNDMTEEDRTLIAKAILEKGLKSSGQNAWWRVASNNWGQVCHTGMMAGALAVAEIDPETCRKQMHESVQNIGIAMRAYAPNGNYPEGVGYWEYGTGYNVIGLSLLFQAFGTDFGLSDFKGFKASGAYFDYLEGPSGRLFAYADGGGSGRSSKAIPWWFARHFAMPQVVEGAERDLLTRINSMTSQPRNIEGGNDWFRALAFFWIFDKGDIEEQTKQDLPLVWDGQGPVPIVIMRNTWDREACTFVGIKGGSPSGPHGHMDSGSFNVDAKKIQWLVDIGCESYNRIETMGIDLWHAHQQSDRWKLFRLNNFGHNTLAIDGQLQLAGGFAKFVSVTDSPKRAVIDLTPNYANVCKKAIRTFELSDDGVLTVTDSLEGLKPTVPVQWAALTRQKVHKVDRSQLTLVRDNVIFTLEATAGDGTWQAQDVTNPLPHYRGNSQNKGVTRLVLTSLAPADGKLTMQVKMFAK